MEKICCGFGHRKIIRKKEVEDIIFETVLDLISKNRVTEFMIGENGDFDSCFLSAVMRAKRKYPDVKLTLVLPYFSNKLNRDKEYYVSFYDDVIIPTEVVGCHYKEAIKKRNQWMIDNTLYVISYIRKNEGGAFSATNYAKKNNKYIISI